MIKLADQTKFFEKSEPVLQKVTFVIFEYSLILTTMIGFIELKNDIGILKDLQMMMIEILSCEEMQTQNKIEKLFSFFEKISISSNFSIYEAFLRLFAHISIFFNVAQNDQRRQLIFNEILKELISKHSLKTIFHQSTLFFIFKLNRHFLLFFIEEGIIDMSIIETQFSYVNRSNDLLFLFFMPEIQKTNPKLYQEQKEKFEMMNYRPNNTENNSNKVLTIYEKTNSAIRKETHSPKKLAKIIREDNLDTFVEYITGKENFDINMKILPSYVEVNPDINNSDHPFLPKGISLLEYSMAFGSINIFRYLWVNKASYKKESLKYSIIGGNYGIVHILEEESLYKFDEENYFQSLKYYRSEISEYLLNLINTKNLSINEILSSYIHSANFDGIYNYLDNKGIFNTILSIKKDNILLQNEIQEIIKLHAFDNPWMPFYLFYNVTFQQSNIDVNWLNSNILSSAYDVINIFSINTDSLTML